MRDHLRVRARGPPMTPICVFAGLHFPQQLDGRPDYHVHSASGRHGQSLCVYQRRVLRQTTRRVCLVNRDVVLIDMSMLCSISGSFSAGVTLHFGRACLAAGE
jgi:hypothetical protein